jgi:hypothetical protein
LICGGESTKGASARATATAVTVTSDSGRSNGGSGNSTTDNSTALPRGVRQSRPRWPRPADCESATITNPAFARTVAAFSAKSFVLATSRHT